MTFTIRQLASNAGNVNISGNNIVWQGGGGISSDSEIYLYNGNSIIQITNNDSDDLSPDISGNNIAWENNYQIYLYNGSSIIQVSDESSYSNTLPPQISGNNVVWEGGGGINFGTNIYLYNGSSTIQLTDNIDDNVINRGHQISGNNVVWYSYDRNSSDSQIYLYNGSSTVQLTGYTTPDGVELSSGYNPQVSGDNIAWLDNSGVVYLYNGSSTIQLTDDGNYHTNDAFGSVQISGNNVVWSGDDGDGSYENEIYLYDGNSTIQLTDNSFYESHPQISGNNVVWQGYDGNDYEIYLYNGSSTVQVTDNNSDDYFPQISGNNLVWTSGYGELFLTTIPLSSSVTTTLPTDVYDLTLTGTANINGIGNELSNAIIGNDANNVIYGKEGDDILLGERGNDRLVGGLGADTLTGGAGADRFIRKYSDTGVDTITDFDVARDSFLVSASGFGGELVSGAVITEAQFTIGVEAADESDRFIYNSATGSLSFDADGTGLSEQIQFAQLSTDLTMTHANIFVFA